MALFMILIAFSAIAAATQTSNGYGCAPEYALYLPHETKFLGDTPQNVSYSLLLRNSASTLRNTFEKSFSVELWFRFLYPSTLEEDPILIGNTADWRKTTNRGFVIAKSKGIHGRGLTINVGTGQVNSYEFWSANWTIYTKRDVQDAQWHHVAVSFDTSTIPPAMHVWVDGLHDASAALTTTVSNTPTHIPPSRLASASDLTIGDEDYETGYFWPLGYVELSEVRIWTHAWNPQTLARTLPDGGLSSTSTGVPPGGFAVGVGPSYDDARGDEAGLSVHMNMTASMDPAWVVLQRVSSGTTRADPTQLPMSTLPTRALPGLLRTQCTATTPGAPPIHQCTNLNGTDCVQQVGCVLVGNDCVVDACYITHPSGPLDLNARAVCINMPQCAFAIHPSSPWNARTGECYTDTVCRGISVQNPPITIPDTCNATAGCRGVGGVCQSDDKQCPFYGATGDRRQCVIAHLNDTVPAPPTLGCRVRSTLTPTAMMTANDCITDPYECAAKTISECVVHPRCRATNVADAFGRYQQHCVADPFDCALQRPDATCSNLPGCRFDPAQNICAVDRIGCSDAQNETACAAAGESCRYSVSLQRCVAAVATTCRPLTAVACRQSTQCVAAARDYGEPTRAGLACAFDPVDCLPDPLTCGGRGCAVNGVCRCHASHSKGFWAGSACTVCAVGYTGPNCNTPSSQIEVFYPQTSAMNTRYLDAAVAVAQDIASALSIPAVSVTAIPSLDFARAHERSYNTESTVPWADESVGGHRYEIGIDASRTAYPGANASFFRGLHDLYILSRRSWLCNGPTEAVAVDDALTNANSTYCPPAGMAAADDNGKSGYVWLFLLLLVVPLICCIVLLCMAFKRHDQHTAATDRYDTLSREFELKLVQSVPLPSQGPSAWDECWTALRARQQLLKDEMRDRAVLFAACATGVRDMQIRHLELSSSRQQQELCDTVTSLQRELQQVRGQRDRELRQAKQAEDEMRRRAGELDRQLREMIEARNRTEELARQAQAKAKSAESRRATDRRALEAAAEAAAREAAAARAETDRLAAEALAMKNALRRAQGEASRLSSNYANIEIQMTQLRADAADASEKLAASDRQRRSAVRNAAELRAAADAQAAAELRARAMAEEAARAAAAERDNARRLQSALSAQESRSRADRARASAKEQQFASEHERRLAVEAELQRLRSILNLATHERDRAYKLAQDAVDHAASQEDAAKKRLMHDRLLEAEARERDARRRLEAFMASMAPAAPEPTATPQSTRRPCSSPSAARGRSPSAGRGRPSSSGPRRGTGGAVGESVIVEGSVPHWVERFIEREEERACALSLNHDCREV